MGSGHNWGQTRKKAQGKELKGCSHMNNELLKAEQELQKLERALNAEFCGHVHCSPSHPSRCADPHHNSSCKSWAEQGTCAPQQGLLLAAKQQQPRSPPVKSLLDHRRCCTRQTPKPCMICAPYGLGATARAGWLTPPASPAGTSREAVEVLLHPSQCLKPADP